jgi:mannose-1-phosphate guanylyltransferase/mannose-6-phosphate isomerase
MFMFSPSQYLEELGRHNPEMVSVCEQALEKAGSDQDFIRLDSDIFATCPSDSIDYAVMEHTENAAVVPVDLGWSDVGAWPALWEIGKRDENDNVIHGDVITLDTHGSYIRSEGSTVATNGIDDLIVVATDDAVLVADKSRAQDVKAIVERIKAEGRNEHETHTTVHRPWGWYQTINLGSRFQVKQICLKPHATISLQMHHHRAEHWVVVEGNARVTRNEEVVDLAENQSTYIPIGTTHRLENPHDELLRIIEVQSGSYLGEDDIVRFDDVYGRT